MKKQHVVKVGQCIGTWVLCVASLPAQSSAQDVVALEELGKRVFFETISEPNRMACATCHVPASGWTSGVAGYNLHQVAVTGADPHTVGGRKPPAVPYASFSPAFGDSIFVGFLGPCGPESPGLSCRGGLFWDGRARGDAIGDEVFAGDASLETAYTGFLGPTADQAVGPFANDVEQNVPDGDDNGMPGAEAVCRAVEEAKYAELFQFAWGEPISCEPAVVDIAFKRIAVAISAWEHSSEVNSFSSRRDIALANDADSTPGAFPLESFTAEENLGHDLFYGTVSELNPTGKNARCSACHNSEAPGSQGTEPQQLYTDQGFHNIGLPPNFEIANFDPAYPDAGLASATGGLGHLGHFRTPTLRNVDQRRGKGVVKAYMHNGYLKSLEDVVHFYNTASLKEDPIACPPGTTAAQARKNDCWPSAEIPFTSSRGSVLLGDLGLTDDEEAALVAYLETLTDTFVVKKPGPYKP